MKLHKETRDELIALQKKGIFLEGNILKILEQEPEHPEYNKYLQEASKKDQESRKKRLEITKDVQIKNNELNKWKEKNQVIQEELKQALTSAEKSKKAALNDLDVLQKKSQFELIGLIVRMALWIIGMSGVCTTLLFAISLWLNLENKLIENVWSNMLGILLTNSFSIIGTIMGVKYADEKKERIESAAFSQGKCETCNK